MASRSVAAAINGAVIPAKAGIHFASQVEAQIKMDSRFRGNDDTCFFSEATGPSAVANCATIDPLRA